MIKSDESVSEVCLLRLELNIHRVHQPRRRKNSLIGSMGNFRLPVKTGMRVLIIGTLCTPVALALECSVVSESSRVGPTGRHGVAAASISNVPYVFGGCNLEDVCFDELYAFHTTTSSWEYLFTRGDAPSARGGASLDQVRGSLFLFGGEANDGTYNDIYKFESRSGHASASDGEKIYIFGGFNEVSHSFISAIHFVTCAIQSGRLLNDFWVIDLDSDLASLSPEQFPVRFHSINQSSGDVPPAREGATLTYVSGHLFLFGGYGADGSHLRTFCHVAGCIRWQKTNGIVLSSEVANRSQERIIIVGGCDSGRSVQRCYSDIWRLDVRSYTWTLLAASDPKLSARERHGAVILSGGKVLIFGGRKLNAVDYANVVSFKVAPCGGGGVCSGRGTCAGASCTCYPGWTSHDCGEVLECPSKCNFAGICLSGTCTCFSGFHGNSCYTVLCPGSGLSGMCNGQGDCLPSGTCSCNCEIDVWGAEERARRAKGAKRRSREHEAANLSALMDFDLREQMAAIWRDIVREAGGDLPPLGQTGDLRGVATVGGAASGGRLSWSLHWPEVKLPSKEEVKETLQTLTEVLTDQLPSISATMRVAMAPVSLAVALVTLYGMYRVNRSRI
ncbi:hypothetical protein Esti_005323 [Eimeria stiedai]